MWAGAPRSASSAARPNRQANASCSERVGLHHRVPARPARARMWTGQPPRSVDGGTHRSRAPDGAWADGYYYVVFEDPDGIRLEINYVPGKGLLAEDRSSCAPFLIEFHRPRSGIDLEGNSLCLRSPFVVSRWAWRRNRHAEPPRGQQRL